MKNAIYKLCKVRNRAATHVHTQSLSWLFPTYLQTLGHWGGSQELEWVPLAGPDGLKGWGRFVGGPALLRVGLR